MFPKPTPMEVHIEPVEGYESVVNEYYRSHGTFHKGDAGLDLFCVETVAVPKRAISVKIPLGIRVEAFYPWTFSVKDDRWTCSKNYPRRQPASFYLFPRSSTGLKTPIRLSNSVGIIDSSFRGHLMAIVDNISDEPFTLKKGERYFQICTPTLGPIVCELVETSLSRTSRGKGGLGSTGE